MRAARIIAAAPVCLYAGALVPRELLDTAPPGARLVDTANLNLDQITAELVAASAAGLDVARLHSGDPSVYSAMAEQMRRLDAAGVPYDVVPGVPAFAAAAAAPVVTVEPEAVETLEGKMLRIPLAAGYGGELFPALDPPAM